MAGDGGRLRLDIMADKQFRDDILDLVRAQVRPSLVELIARTVAPAELQAALNTYLKTEGLYKLTDMFSARLYQQLTQDRGFVEKVVQAAQKHFDQELDKVLEEKIDRKLVVLVERLLTNARITTRG